MKETGACIFCGQIHMVGVSEGATEAQINRVATLCCDCYDAKQEQEIEKSVNEAKEYIAQSFENEDIKKLLAWEVELIVRNIIIKATANEGNAKVTISKNTKGHIKIDKTKTIKEEITI